MGGSTKDDAIFYFSASGIAAVINFPLWRASAIAQSGFKLEGRNIFEKYYKAVMRPPYKGVAATMIGMTWARAAIFYGSDVGKQAMLSAGVDGTIAQTMPPLLIGTFVQVVNMPLVRATITIQDPSSPFNSVTTAIRHIYATRGVRGLWHGVEAGIMKTVPKYVTAVAVKDYMESNLPAIRGELADPSHPHHKYASMVRSGVKSVVAGLAGAVLTNPLDVLRNEMFKTDLPFLDTCKKVYQEEGWYFMTRGITSNMVAVAIPIAITIFMTDVLKSSFGSKTSSAAAGREYTSSQSVRRTAAVAVEASPATGATSANPNAAAAVDSDGTSAKRTQSLK